MMMAEYAKPEEKVAMSGIGNDEENPVRKRKGSWRFNNNILDLDAIEKSSKAFSSRDASEINESPMMSPSNHVGGKKKSRFAPMTNFGNMS
jgi:hypothetical protein